MTVLNHHAYTSAHPPQRDKNARFSDDSAARTSWPAMGNLRNSPITPSCVSAGDSLARCTPRLLRLYPIVGLSSHLTERNRYGIYRFVVSSTCTTPAFRVQSWFYQPQVRMQFPQSVLREIAATLPSAPNGYSIRSHEGQADLEPWAQLLNEDGGFGPWDGERIRSELLSQLMTPDSSSLLFHGHVMVGVAVQ